MRQFAGPAQPVAHGTDPSLFPLLAEAARVSRNAIVVTDAQLNEPGPLIVWVNEAFERLTGYSRVEVVGRNPRVLQGPGTDYRVLRRLRSLLEQGDDFEGEAINYRRDGTPFVMSWRTSAILDLDGTPTHYVAIQEDVTASRMRDDDERSATLALQHALLPSLPDSIGPFAIGHAYRPASFQLVGGDWFDVIELPGPGCHLLVVGDVAGHGTAAVAAMGQMRWATQAAALAGLDLAEIMATLRRLASAQGLMATLLLLVIDDAGSIHYLCAGHPPALVFAADGSTRELGTTAPLVGPNIASPERTGRDRLAPGEWLIAYTDGLIERRRRSFDEGLDLLRDRGRALIDQRSDATAGPDEVAAALVESLTTDSESEDDIAVVVLRGAIEDEESNPCRDR